MEIRFTFKGRVIVISVGYVSCWHRSIHFIDIVEEFYCNHELVDAKILYSFFKRRNSKLMLAIDPTDKNKKTCNDFDKNFKN